jgi:Zn-dependent M28 family amino/carboxypeptidase
MNVSIPELKAHVRFFTDLKPARNWLNTESLNKAADYIAAHFDKTLGNSERQWFEVEGKRYQNVICRFGPQEGPRFVIGAHYDVEGDSPGADDNASAVAGLLEIARLLSLHEGKLPHPVELVAYTLEEPPYFTTESMGSLYHASQLKENNIPVKLMISLEMIGYFTDQPNSQQYPDPSLLQVYPSIGNFIGVIGKIGQESAVREVTRLMKEKCDIGVESINAPVEMPGIANSDHRNYWRMGYDAVMIDDTSFYRNPNYHTNYDTMDTLDFEKMAEVVKGAFWTVVGYGV